MPTTTGFIWAFKYNKRQTTVNNWRHSFRPNVNRSSIHWQVRVWLCAQALHPSVICEALMSKGKSSADIACLVLLTVRQNCKSFTSAELSVYVLLLIRTFDISLKLWLEISSNYTVVVCVWQSYFITTRRLICFVWLLGLFVSCSAIVFCRSENS